MEHACGGSRTRARGGGRGPGAGGVGAIGDDAAARTAARSRPAPGRRCSGSRTAASTRTAGTSPARWAGSSRRRSSCSTRCRSASTASGSGRRRGSRAAGATRATTCRPSTGCGCAAPTSCPTACRGALLGLEITNPSHRQRTVEVMVDAHSELMTQYPWGFAGTVPNASDNRPDTRRGRARRGSSFRDGDFTAIVGSDRRATGGEVGPGHYGPFGAGRVCAPEPPDEMPRDCDDGPFGRGTGGQLRYEVRLQGRRDARRCGSPSPARTTRPARRAASTRGSTHKPERQLAAKRADRAALGRWSKVSLPGNRLLQESVDWGKQNLADLTQEATDVEVRWTERGQGQRVRGRACRAIGWVGAGFPDYPWLFAHRRRVHRARERRARPVRGDQGAHARAARRLGHPQRRLGRRRARDGRRRLGLARQGHAPTNGVPDFNTDEIVKFPSAVALIWRWTGDDAFRDEMLDFTRRNLAYVRDHLDDGRRRLARGQRQRRAARHGHGEARQRRLLHPRPVRLRRHGRSTRPAKARADELAAQLRGRLVDGGRERPTRTRSPTRATSRPTRSTGSARTRWRPSSTSTASSCPGSPRSSTARRRSPRARTTATAASGPATAACSTPAAAAVPRARASSPSSRSAPA